LLSFSRILTGCWLKRYDTYRIVPDKLGQVGRQKTSAAARVCLRVGSLGCPRSNVALPLRQQLPAGRVCPQPNREPSRTPWATPDLTRLLGAAAAWPICHKEKRMLWYRPALRPSWAKASFRSAERNKRRRDKRSSPQCLSLRMIPSNTARLV
jgi:hypothetical protein